MRNRLLAAFLGLSILTSAVAPAFADEVLHLAMPRVKSPEELAAERAAAERAAAKRAERARVEAATRQKDALVQAEIERAGLAWVAQDTAKQAEIARKVRDAREKLQAEVRAQKAKCAAEGRKHCSGATRQ